MGRIVVAAPVVHRRWVAVGLLAVLGLLAGCAGRPAPATALIQVFAPADRQTAPELTGELLDGSGTYDPATHAGQVLVVNIWASWCGPCVGEAPELEAVYSAYKDRGVAFLGINVRDERDAARAFARQHTTYPSIVDPSSRLMLGFNVHPNAIPATIVIDRQGRVAAIAQSAIVASELEPVVVALLEESS
ncbi:MAG: TlpA family protein disulfide reductase [Micromonosporaceae bacterium]|nr:TlpA family protein disulfide reductase [Micromonosporaceae bacterium]